MKSTTCSITEKAHGSGHTLLNLWKALKTELIFLRGLHYGLSGVRGIIQIGLEHRSYEKAPFFPALRRMQGEMRILQPKHNNRYRRYPFA